MSPPNKCQKKLFAGVLWNYSFQKCIKIHKEISAVEF